MECVIDLKQDFHCIRRREYDNRTIYQTICRSKEKRLLNNDLIREERKEDAIKRIDRAVKMRERGLITEDDCIIRICDCIKN